MFLLRVSLLVALGLSAGAAFGAIELHSFDDPVLQQRYESLTSSMRCPKCENQAIDDSNSPVAKDMRERVASLLRDDLSDIEIQNFMVDRFGDYVLYNPRLEGRTYLLWGLPAGLVLLGAMLVFLILRLRRQSSAKSLSAEERARLNALIEGKKPK
ncbi:cytochrome c-type biogenesis protein [Pistricoccus aurantiacus]|uniref:cytochrome c-type biogenesis protein n=1 Tax=Pistricoccus aurantiacus TaxID=1883414 RepID=UPI0036291C42